MTNDRIKFDVACALAVVSPNVELPNIFPQHLTVDGPLLKILTDCIENTSFKSSSCTIRKDVPQTDQYSLQIGTDKLKLAPGGEIILGGGGVTVQLHDPAIGRFFALKVPRVSVLAYKGPQFDSLDATSFESRFSNEVKAFENERLIFRRLSHQNIAQHLFGSVKKIDFGSGVPGFDRQAKLPFSVSEWIDGALPLHEYIRAHLGTEANRNELSLDKLISLIEQSFDALTHLQERKILHWDIKCDNLLVSKGHVVKLIDFGNAKKLDLLDSVEDLIVTTTKFKYPTISLFKTEETGHSESRRYRIRLPDLTWNHPLIDMWMLAQEWNRCLSISSQFLVTEAVGNGKGQLTATERNKLQGLLLHGSDPKAADRLDCLRLIFDWILFPLDRQYLDHFIAGVRFKPAKLYYGGRGSVRGASEVVSELRRISSPFGDGGRVSELLVSLDDIVRLPVTGNSVFTRRVQAIAECDVVRPTRGHNQLGQVKRVFPGATHSRYEHLLGTLTTTTQFVKSLYLNEMNAFWRVSVEASDIDAVLLAAILHDVGHIAYGHFVEEMSDLFYGLKHTDYTIAILNACLIKLGRNIKPTQAEEILNPPPNHVDELITIIGTHWVRTPLLSPEVTIQESIAAFIEHVQHIFQATSVNSDLPTYLSRDATKAAVNTIMRSIIDGPLDADKLDYLRRDALHAGVLFASGIDLERFFESLRTCVDTTGKQVIAAPAIGISEKGIAPIESIVTARYHLFSAVYWHRTTRCITATLQRILSEVFLALNNEEWAKFLKSFLAEFRENDDAAALVWLEKTIKQTKVERRPLSTVRLGVADRGLTIGNLVDVLLGNRSQYFKVAFELTYVGAIFPIDKRGMLGREKLHEEICSSVHGEKPETRGIANISAVRERRIQLANFRKELESKFEEKIRALGHKAFQLDTILLDVPEPGKDQISALNADNRTKRSQVSDGFLDKLKLLFPRSSVRPKPEFTEVRGISPIAGSLDHALDRWARKIRLFMAPDDLAQLTKLQFAKGDIALLWEHILYDHFEIHDENQSELLLVGI